MVKPKPAVSKRITTFSKRNCDYNDCSYKNSKRPCILILDSIAHDYTYDIEILKKNLMPGLTIFHNLTMLKMVNAERQ